MTYTQIIDMMNELGWYRDALSLKSDLENNLVSLSDTASMESLKHLIAPLLYLRAMAGPKEDLPLYINNPSLQSIVQYRLKKGW